MATLRDKLQQDLKQAMRESKVDEVSVLRLVMSAAINREKEKRAGIVKQHPESDRRDLERESVLTDGEILDVIVSEAKKRREAISEFEKGKRIDLANKEKHELVILQRYMPEPMSDDQVKNLIRSAIDELHAEGLQDLGKVMSRVAAQTKSRAEGARVSQFVKEMLNQRCPGI